MYVDSNVGLSHSDLKTRICEVERCDGTENCPKNPGDSVAWDEEGCIPYQNVTFQPIETTKPSK
jgi:hypothetical protein